MFLNLWVNDTSFAANIALGQTGALIIVTFIDSSLGLLGIRKSQLSVSNIPLLDGAVLLKAGLTTSACVYLVFFGNTIMCFALVSLSLNTLFSQHIIYMKKYFVGSIITSGPTFMAFLGYFLHKDPELLVLSYFYISFFLALFSFKWFFNFSALKATLEKIKEFTPNLKPMIGSSILGSLMARLDVIAANLIGGEVLVNLMRTSSALMAFGALLLGASATKSLNAIGGSKCYEESNLRLRDQNQINVVQYFPLLIINIIAAYLIVTLFQLDGRLILISFGYFCKFCLGLFLVPFSQWGYRVGFESYYFKLNCFQLSFIFLCIYLFQSIGYYTDLVVISSIVLTECFIWVLYWHKGILSNKKRAKHWNTNILQKIPTR